MWPLTFLFDPTVKCSRQEAVRILIPDMHGRWLRVTRRATASIRTCVLVKQVSGVPRNWYRHLRSIELRLSGLVPRNN
jgi:hypothetical protein